MAVDFAGSIVAFALLGGDIALGADLFRERFLALRIFDLAGPIC
jgi:hypothetical protein